MSRSSRSTRHGPSHSRRSRAPADDLLVTQAGLQSLHLSPSSVNQSFPDPLSSYTPYPAADSTVSYLQSSYGLNPFQPPSSPGPFAGLDQSHLDPRTVVYSPSPALSIMPGPSMPFYSSQSPLIGHGGQRHTYEQPLTSMSGYYDAPASNDRSMSGSTGPSLAQSSAMNMFSPEERNVARRRRRGSQESRRQSKVIVRRTRTRLPSNFDAGLGGTQGVGGSVDFLAAPSVSSTSYGGGGPTSRYISRSPLGSSGPPGQYPSYTSSQSAATGHSPSYGYSSSPAYSTTSSTTLHAPYPSSGRDPVTISAAPRIVATRDKPQCWDHGCNGREFSTFSNLLRHQREKSGTATKSYCPNCGAEFTRTTARNGHIEQGKCKPRRSSGD